MKKIVSLIKACMTDNMNLFKIRSKNQSVASKKLLPIFVAVVLFFSIWTYAKMIIEQLIPVHMEVFLLTLFVVLFSILTIVEGIYKAGNLLFNCKDDNLLLSLPIKKSTVLFIRILKFYLFELLYNSLFILPAMVVYVQYVNVTWTFYLVSFFTILLLPIVPIVISCIIGGIISYSSSKFKLKNIAQIAITMVFLLAVFLVSFNLQTIIGNLAQNATSINDIITNLYYPAGAYIKLITDFNIIDFAIYFLVHVGIFAITVFALSKIYYKINSKVKNVKTSSNNSNYRIITNSPIKALIKKELNRFATSPVFVINAAFGLVLFVVGCIFMCIKFDSIAALISEQGIRIIPEQLRTYIPAILFGFICVSSLMSSITSSMISLEGKTFNILKSMPAKPSTIINSKILTAVLIMIPVILVGDFIVFIKFGFNILEIIMILLASIILPLVSETIGILVNIKYPKMDAENDTEVVKQSISSMIAVFTGMILTGVTIFGIVRAIMAGMTVNIIIALGILVYSVIYAVLLLYLNKKGIKEFNKINI